MNQESMKKEDTTLIKGKSQCATQTGLSFVASCTCSCNFVLPTSRELIPVMWKLTVTLSGETPLGICF